MDAEHWNHVYDQTELVWSAGPNVWVEQVTSGLAPGVVRRPTQDSAHRLGNQNDVGYAHVEAQTDEGQERHAKTLPK